MGEISINITIAERTYPLVIAMEHEELIRKAAKEVNENIAQYKAQYSYKDYQDLLAFVVISLSSKLIEIEHKEDNETALISQKVIEIDETLQRAFEKL